MSAKKPVYVQEIQIGGYFEHPSAGTVLRRVEPKFAVPDAIYGRIFAHDQEGNLYSFDVGTEVEVPFNVPLVTEKCDDTYLIHATFERQVSDDLEVVQNSFKNGRIEADPDKNLPLAVMQQLALEMGEAYDNGLAGHFQCHAVSLNRAFDRKKMGYKRDNAPQKTGAES